MTPVPWSSGTQNRWFGVSEALQMNLECFNYNEHAAVEAQASYKISGGSESPMFP